MYLTRDDDNTLSLHSEFPNKTLICGYNSYWSSHMIDLQEDLFPEVTVESGPVEVELSIKPSKGLMQ